ncbi:MAG: PAS domain-containing protein, partial [Rhodoferax sp.]|uniref:PAS domain-containing protein n=1 Tax=Rhodoferax sp. TaxID=50421 RepID=UPI003BAE20B7
MDENDLIYSFAREHAIPASGLVALMVPQTLGAAIGVKDLDGRYHLGNGVMQKLFGKSFEQIVGITDAELFPPEVARQLQQSDQNIRAGVTTSSDNLDFFMNGERVQCLLFKFTGYPFSSKKRQARCQGNFRRDSNVPSSGADLCDERRQSARSG